MPDVAAVDVDADADVWTWDKRYSCVTLAIWLQCLVAAVAGCWLLLLLVAAGAVDCSFTYCGRRGVVVGVVFVQPSIAVVQMASGDEGKKIVSRGIGRVVSSRLASCRALSRPVVPSRYRRWEGVE
jgi:hypothetical protein